MGIKLWSTVGTLALAFALTGCDKTPEPTVTPAPAPAAPTEAPAQLPPPPATMATQPVPSMTNNTPAPTMATTPTTTPAAIPADPVTPTAVQAAQTQANTLIQQGIDYVKANKLDLAETALTKLQGMKPSLPASFGPKIDELKTMIDAAQLSNGKTPSGLKIPGM